jgi:hypothetical protein
MTYTELATMFCSAIIVMFWVMKDNVTAYEQYIYILVYRAFGKSLCT